MKFALTTLISLISIGALANPLPFYFPGDKKALDSNRCESAKEFIATFDFIRQNPELVDNQEKAIQISSQVAEGCTGSAKRFIGVANSLKQLQVPVTEVLTFSLELSRKDDATAETFVKALKKNIAEDGFHLPMSRGLKIAESLSLNFQSSAEQALRDFDKVADLCIQKNEFKMNLEECAELSKRVALLGKTDAVPAGESFVRSYRYLQNSAGLTAQDSVKLAEKLLAMDPAAFENFRTSYEFAVSEKGLKSNRPQALELAQRMADLTVKRPSSTH